MTISLELALVTSVLGILVWMIFRFQQDQSGQLWAYGMLCNALGVLFLSLRGTSLDVLSFLVPGFCIVYSNILFAYSLRYLAGDLTRNSWAAEIFCALFALAFLLLHELRLDDWFASYASAGLSMTSLWVGLDIGRTNQRINSRYISAMQYLFFVSAALWLGILVTYRMFGIAVLIDTDAERLSTPAILITVGLMRHVLYFALRLHRVTREKEQIKNRKSFLESVLLKNKIKMALESGLIKPHYQPVVELLSGKITSFEALARWSDDDFGAVAPDTFIPVAEQTGLITTLTERIVDQVLADLPGIRSRFPDSRVAINISSALFKDSTVVKIFGSRFARAKADYPSLTLEVVEGEILDTDVTAAAQLGALREWGLGLSIDDFGKEYSSHSRLASLSFSNLKIDQDFIQHLDTQKTARIVVKNIISLAQDLGITVTAEGIETIRQREILIELGCGQGQGWLFGAALTAAQLLELPLVLGAGQLEK